MNLPHPRLLTLLAILFVGGLREAPGVADEHVDDRSVQRMLTICGPNSLYLLLRINGIDLKYSDLESRLTMETWGADLRSMKQAAASFGLSGRVRKCTLKSLENANLPLIAHLNHGFRIGDVGRHYIFIISITPRGIVFIDGTTGARDEASLGKFESAWSGYILEATPNSHMILFSVIAQFCLIICIIMAFKQMRRPRRKDAAGIALAAMSYLLGSPGAVGAQPGVPAASTPEEIWRAGTNDAVNSLDLYYRILGAPIPRDRVRSQLVGSGEGAKLSDLARASHVSGWSLRAARLSPARLSAIPKPVIVHLVDDEDHGNYFVLYDISNNVYHVINSASVTLEFLSSDEFRRRWSGYALVPSAGEGPWLLTACILFVVGYACLRTMLVIVARGRRRKVPGPAT
jgi:ABC-type bacteriocin/lantibiotic exporter with double-glycine peptidase domain